MNGYLPNLSFVVNDVKLNSYYNHIVDQYKQKLTLA